MKKRILFITEKMVIGGVEKTLLNLIQNIDKDKYSIECKVIYKGGDWDSRLMKLVPVSYVFGETPSIITIRIYNLVLRLLPGLIRNIYFRKKYDIVAIFSSLGFYPLVTKNTHIIEWIHNDYSYNYAPPKTIKNKLGRKILDKANNRVNTFICVSNSARNSFVKIYGEHLKTTVIYNPIDTCEIIDKSNEGIDEDFLFKAKGLKLISVGRLTYQKGYDRLLECCYRLIKDGIEFNLLIIGDGEDKNNLLEYLSSYRLHEKIHFIGFNNNPYKYISRCDLFVCASRFEGYSTAVTEALILGKPIISTNCSGAEELLQNGQYGLIVENNTESLYIGLKELLTNPTLYNHFANMATLRSEFFSLTKSIEVIEQLFDCL